MAERFRFGLDSAVLVALIGILSGVVGAYATAAATSRNTLRQNVIELRTKAYAQFLQGQSLRRGASNQDETAKANNLIRESKLNILMVASREVICSTVTYWLDAFPTEYPVCGNDKLEKENAAIYQAMRNEFFVSLGLKDPEVDSSLIVPYLANPSCILSGTNSTTMNRICRGSAVEK